jgi:hypothetical protein
LDTDAIDGGSRVGGSRWSTASTRANPLFAPSSTPCCIVVSRASVVAKHIVCVSFVGREFGAAMQTAAAKAGTIMVQSGRRTLSSARAARPNGRRRI